MSKRKRIGTDWNEFASSFPPLMQGLEARRLFCAGEDDCTAGPTRAVVSINAGGLDTVDSSGHAFAADAGFEGGKAITLSGAISQTADDALFQSVREGKTFNFSAKVPNGRYTLELSFADDHKTVRRFDVRAEDQLIASNYRVPTAMTAIVRKFNVEVTDGRLSLGFSADAGRAIVSAIMLTPGASFFPDSINWRANADIPVVREEAQSFTWQNRLYVLGGYVDGLFAATTRFDRYDPRTDTWKRLAPMPEKFTHAGVAVDEKNGTVWFVGGYVGDFPDPSGSARVWKFDIVANTWSREVNIPAARGAGGAGIVGRKLYFFSGGNKERTADQGDQWALDLDNPTKWRTRASLPNPRNHFGTAVVNDQIYVIGGQLLLEADSTNQADVHRYDVTTDTWTALASLPRPYSHFTFSSGVFNNRYIVMAGGESPHDVARTDSFAFDTRRNQWGELTPLPANRRAPAGGIIDDRLYVVAGYDREVGQTSSVWSADLVPAFT